MVIWEASGEAERVVSAALGDAYLAERGTQGPGLTFRGV
jgi:hypothetical protein